MVMAVTESIVLVRVGAVLVGLRIEKVARRWLNLLVELKYLNDIGLLTIACPLLARVLII